jgi:hypothetical protein
MLVPQVAAGYAASSTDGGLALDNPVDPQHGSWALKEDGWPNEELQLNLAWGSVHDMAVVSKDIIKQFYRMDASFVLSWLFPGRVAGLRSCHGPVPNEPLETLVSWVEQGIAPGVLPATRTGGGDVEVTRDLCTYPQKLVYQEGDVNPASSLRASRCIVAANKDPIVSTDKSARIVTCSHSY